MRERILGSILRGFRECLLPVLKQCQKLQLQRFDTPTGKALRRGGNIFKQKNKS